MQSGALATGRKGPVETLLVLSYNELIVKKGGLLSDLLDPIFADTNAMCSADETAFKLDLDDVELVGIVEVTPDNIEYLLRLDASLS